MQIALQDGVNETRSRGRGFRDRMLAGTNVVERCLMLAGTATELFEVGEGPPLILMHGGVETGGAYWAPVLSQLARDYRVIVPDVPGLGETQQAETLDDAFFAEWFAAFIRETCDEKPILVVHSLLGTLAARFAANDGALLRRLVLYGVPGVSRYRMPLGLMITAMLFDLKPNQRNQERFVRWALLDAERAYEQEPEWFEAFDAYSLERGRQSHVKRTMRQLVGICTKQLSANELSRIDIPTALLWGRQDRMTPLTLATQASATLGWPLYIVDDAGHACHLEQPLSFVQQLRLAIGEKMNSTVDFGGGSR